MISLGHFLSLGGLLFAMSVIGIFLNRKNLIPAASRNVGPKSRFWTRS